MDWVKDSDVLTMSVWGCCVGRNIFNAPQLVDSIKVENFVFQITPYSCFDVPLNIPYEKFDIPIFTKFEKECLDFNLNKTCIEKLEKNKTDYITFDFVSSSFEMFQITFNKKTTIARMWEGRRLLSLLCFSVKRVNSRHRFSGICGR